MTADRDLDRQLTTWLDERAALGVPEGLLARSLARVEVTRQRPGWLVGDWRALRLPRRLKTMSMLTRVAVAAIIGVIAVGGAFYLMRPDQPAIGGPAPTPAASAGPSQPAATPAPAPGQTGTMTSGRGFQTATLLADGRVLIVGGYASGQVPLASAEIYDPSTGTFTVTGSMTVGRAEHTATMLSDDRVLITGGITRGSRLASAEIYDPATGTFGPTGSMTDGRARHRATLLADGRVLVTGGDGVLAQAPLASAELYDPTTGTFSATGSMAAPAGALHSATLLSDDRVLVAGGGSASDGRCYATAEIYDSATGTFSPTGSLTTPRCGHTATLFPDGRVLMTTGTKNWQGTGYQSSAELYDPATGTFSPTGSMATAPAAQTATLLSDGRVLVAGGNQVTSQSLASAELYDPATGTFGPTGSMTDARTLQTATLLSDGRVLVTGGESVGWNFAGPFLASVELYDPATGTFSPAGPGG
jgi:hypothetical protein